MNGISRGSLVRLRGGIPESLRVLGVSSDGPAIPAVAVCWHAEDGRLRRAVLPADLLEPQALAVPGGDGGEGTATAGKA